MNIKELEKEIFARKVHTKCGEILSFVGFEKSMRLVVASTKGGSLVALMPQEIKTITVERKQIEDELL